MHNFLKDKAMHDKHSFKLVDSVQDIFSKPGHLVFLVALLLFTMINVNVTNGPVSTGNINSSSVVLGEATSIEANDPENQVVMYKLSIQNLVVPYIEQRINYLTSLESEELTDLDRNDWRGIIKQTQNAILALTVPVRFKDTHLIIVSVLMEEGSVLEQSAAYEVLDFDATSISWEDILLRNSWLNELQAL